MKKTAKKSEPALRCAHTALMPVAELAAKVHPANPNTHPAAQIELMAKIIEHTGWRRAIRLSKRSGRITAGHCSLLACQLRGWAKAPVDLQDYATEADELADLAADNELARLAQTDDAALQALLQQLDTAGLDRELAGILDELKKQAEDGGEPPAFNYQEQYGVIVICKDEKAQAAVFKKLQADGYDCKVVVT